MFPPFLPTILVEIGGLDYLIIYS